MEYETIRLRLQPTSEGSYHVLAASAGGETSGEFRLPFDARDLKIFLSRFEGHDVVFGV